MGSNVRSKDSFVKWLALMLTEFLNFLLAKAEFEYKISI